MVYIDEEGNSHNDMKAYGESIMKDYRPTLYEECLDLWGAKEQIFKASEELGELMVAMHHWLGDKATKEQLAEEVADVEIICGQLRCLVGNGLVSNLKLKKLERLRERVDLAKKEKTSSN